MLFSLPLFSSSLCIFTLNISSLKVSTKNEKKQCESLDHLTGCEKHLLVPVYFLISYVMQAKSLGHIKPWAPHIPNKMTGKGARQNPFNLLSMMTIPTFEVPQQYCSRM